VEAVVEVRWLIVNALEGILEVAVNTETFLEMMLMEKMVGVEVEELLTERLNNKL
jgi:hypothetical protein